MMSQEDMMQLGKLALVVALLAVLAFQVSAVPICEVDLTISEDDKVEFLKGIAYHGEDKGDLYPFSKYQVQVEMPGKRAKYGIPVVFFVPHVGEVDKVFITAPFVCDSWEEFTTLKNGVEIFSKNITDFFCDENSVCGLNENEVSCPSDCPPGSSDGWCSRAADNVCDPDCLFGDPDCVQQPSLIQVLATVPEQCNNNGVCDLYENGINCPNDCKKEVVVQPRKTVTTIEQGKVVDSYIAEKIFITTVMILVIASAVFLYRRKKSSSQVKPPRYFS